MLDSKIDVTFNRKAHPVEFCVKLNLKVSTCLIMARIYVLYFAKGGMREASKWCKLNK